jgi:ribokinase
MRRLVVAGSINTDLVVRVRRFPRPGETVVGSSFNTYGGGKGANQACAAARLGATVTMLGAVGDDAYREQRLAGLRDAGVSTERVLTRADVPGGIALIQVEETGQNAIVLVPGANDSVTPSDIEGHLPALLEDRDILCAQFELPLESVRAALEVARDNGALTVVNTAPFVEGGGDLLPLIDVLVVNEIEAGQLLDREPVSVEEAPEAAAMLLENGPGAVFITLGAAGAYILGTDTRRQIAAPRVEVIDTTGAGDACVGAFVAALAQDWTLDAAAERAVFAGSFAVQRHGAQSSQPTVEELDEFIARHRDS